jgi:hypothetical protein
MWLPETVKQTSGNYGAHKQSFRSHVKVPGIFRSIISQDCLRALDYLTHQCLRARLNGVFTLDKTVTATMLTTDSWHTMNAMLAIHETSFSDCGRVQVWPRWLDEKLGRLGWFLMSGSMGPRWRDTTSTTSCFPRRAARSSRRGYFGAMSNSRIDSTLPFLSTRPAPGDEAGTNYFLLMS